jgi:prepilin-type N-terminal cleavage/methylation domain-containing protein
MKRAKRAPAHDGFTLLEVMIAVAITGMAIVMLLQTHNGSLRLYERSREMTIAQHIARELISEIEASGYPGDIEEGVDTTDKYPGFGWHRTCRMLGESAPGVYEVTVIVRGPVEEYLVMTHLMEGAP